MAKAKERFLRHLAQGWSVELAAQGAGLGYGTVYEHRARDAAFAAAWDQAIERGTDRLEDEARRRAVDGVEEPIIHNGKIVGSRLRYSDVLLITLLNARRPEKFKYRTEVTTKQEPIDLSRLSDRQLKALEDIRRTLRGEPPARKGAHDRDASDDARGDPAAPSAVH